MKKYLKITLASCFFLTLLILNQSCKQSEEEGITSEVSDSALQNSTEIEVLKSTFSLNDSSGNIREYDLYHSKQIKEAPLILAFHGGARSKEKLAQLTCSNGAIDNADCLHNLAVKKGFFVAYANGYSSTQNIKTWNGGNCCGPAVRDGIDDVQFARSLVTDIASRFDINREKVFATGVSNGAIFSIRLACEASDLVKAIAPVAGGLGLNSCNPAFARPIMQFHGLADTKYPYSGGAGDGASFVNFISIPDTLATWSTILGCVGEENQINIGSEIADSTSVVEIKKTDCDRRYVHYKITNGGHTWPDGFQYQPTANVGSVSRKINANKLIIEFFQQF